jgi:hypothetical protein
MSVRLYRFSMDLMTNGSVLEIAFADLGRAATAPAAPFRLCTAN